MYLQISRDGRSTTFSEEPDTYVPIENGGLRLLRTKANTTAMVELSHDEVCMIVQLEHERLTKVWGTLPPPPLEEPPK